MAIILFIIILYVSFFSCLFYIRKLELTKKFPVITTLIFGITARDPAISLPYKTPRRSQKRR